MHNGDTPYECDICGKKFVQRTLLKSHSLLVHTNVRPFKCDICQKLFKQKSCLSTHMLVHTNEKSFKCESCGKQFKHKRTLASHLRLRNCNTRKKDKAYECDVCGKHFKQKGHLKSHLRLHIPPSDDYKEYDAPENQCVIKECSKNSQFSFPNSTKSSSDKIYKWNVCGKLFEQKVDLAPHFLIHANNNGKD